MIIVIGMVIGIIWKNARVIRMFDVTSADKKKYFQQDWRARETKNPMMEE